MNAPRRRPWLALGLGLLATVALGLASRKYPVLFPAFLDKYPGDALWALMVFLIWGCVWPRATTLRLAAMALATSFGVEFLQLYQAPWLVAIRGTTAGHLVLGSTFSWIDLCAYAVGVVVGAGLDGRWHALQRWRARHSSGRHPC